MKKTEEGRPHGGNSTYVPGVTQTSVGAATQKHGTQNTVLVVDDDADLRDSLADLLRDEGYAVTLASNGREALDLLPGLQRPCGIVLDIDMPVMNGRQFYQAMRAVPAWADIPIVVLSCEPSQAPNGLPRMKKTNLATVLTMVAGLF